MQYILTKEELDNLVSKKEFDFEKEKLTMLLKQYRKIGCEKDKNMGYCDECPISSLENGLSRHQAFCKDQEYSK